MYNMAECGIEPPTAFRAIFLQAENKGKPKGIPLIYFNSEILTVFQ